jgi:hypothetical protein
MSIPLDKVLHININIDDLKTERGILSTKDLSNTPLNKNNSRESGALVL